MLADEAAVGGERPTVWSRPLPKDVLPPPPGVGAESVQTPGDQNAGSVENGLWEAVFGKTPMEQAKSLLAAFALAGIVSRLMRAG
jgi:hypothetical protein